MHVTCDDNKKIWGGVSLFFTLFVRINFTHCCSDEDSALSPMSKLRMRGVVCVCVIENKGRGQWIKKDKKKGVGLLSG